MADNFDGVARKLVLRSPNTSLLLAYDFVRNAFHDVVERRRWSWMFKRGQLFTTNQYNTGTASINAGDTTVTLNGGAATSDLVGQQFRLGVSSMITTIIDTPTINTLTISDPWLPATIVNQAYSIYTAYVTLPSDFHAFVSVIDPTFAQPVAYLGTVEQLDNTDPQRASSGSPPRILARLDYFQGFPRYELWPHQRSASVYPIIYESRPIDAFDPGSVVPPLLPPDILLERALMYLAMWPGETKTNPNPYYDLKLASQHGALYEARMARLEKQDNEHMQQNVWYQQDQTRRTPVVSGSWMQSHDPSSY